MKTILSNLILFTLLFFATANNAHGIEISATLINVHSFVNKFSKNFDNKIDSKGYAINNPFFTIDNGKFGIIFGEDSVGSAIHGAYYKQLLQEDLSVLIGAYSYNEKKWEKRGVENSLGEAFNCIPFFAIKKDFKIDDNNKVFVYTSGLVSGVGISINFGGN